MKDDDGMNNLDQIIARTKWRDILIPFGLAIAVLIAIVLVGVFTKGA